MNLALQGGYLNECPRDVVFAFLAVPVIALAVLGLAHPEMRARYYLLGANKKMTLTAFILGGAIVGFALWILFVVTHPTTTAPPKIGTETDKTLSTKESPVLQAGPLGNVSSPMPTPTPTPTPRHINTFTPREIHNEMARTGPFELKEVGESFVNGVVDWTLLFSSVHGSRGDPAIQVNFGPEDGFPPTVICTQMPLKGNEYLGRIKSPIRFRVHGVISGVHENTIVLIEATVEQLPNTSPSPSQGSKVLPTPVPDAGPRVVPPKIPPVTNSDAGPRVVPPSPTPPTYSSMTSAELKEATQRFNKRLREFDQEFRGDEYRAIVRDEEEGIGKTPDMSPLDRSLSVNKHIAKRRGQLRDKYQRLFTGDGFNATGTLSAEASALGSALQNRIDPDAYAGSIELEKKATAKRGTFTDTNAVRDLIAYLEYLSQHLRPD